MIWFNVPIAEAQKRLDEAEGILATALKPRQVRQAIDSPKAKSFYLCVDGGGSKTHAVITTFGSLDTGGMEAEGNAGPCNAYVEHL